MRIRTLESDCSRLLAENLALRERAMHLQHTVDKQSSSLSFENIDAVKSQLEAKMQELGSLVAQLGQPKQSDRRRKSQQLARHRPQERQFKSGLCIQEVEQRMMPTIDEGSDYPRHTMNADQIRDIMDDPESHSPDLGPPPTSSFEAEEPIAFDPIPVPDEPMEDATAEDEPALPMNLETRKKRRESGPKLNVRRISVFESPEKTKEEVAKPVRTGAKRKFSVQEDEDRTAGQEEQFNFNRKNVQETDVENQEPRATSPARPILGNSKLDLLFSHSVTLTFSEPVNTDPVLSPKKQRSSSVKEQEKPQKKKLPSVNPRGRQRLAITRTITPPELPMLSAPEPVPIADIVLDSLPPKTPAADVIFSPPSTEPSTSRPDNKDTPPPGDVSSGNQTGQAGRPARRARPQVSYKEPSLNVKMRRDGKLADAIVPQTEKRTSVERQLAPLTSGRMEVKSETTEEEAEMGSPLRQKLDRRENTSPPEQTSTTVSITSRAISALIDETSTARRRTSSAFTSKSADEIPSESAQPNALQEPAVKQQVANKDNLAIFEFTESSPVDTSRPKMNDLANAARNARRHSSVSGLATTESEKPEGSLPSLHKRNGSGTVRSASTASLAKSTSAARLNAKKASVPAATTTKMVDVKVKGDGAAPAGAEQASAASTLRAERIASRRKSMML